MSSRRVGMPSKAAARARCSAPNRSRSSSSSPRGGTEYSCPAALKHTARQIRLADHDGDKALALLHRARHGCGELLAAPPGLDPVGADDGHHGVGVRQPFLQL
nr:hypothetical protein [Streptomyces antibioticus]